MNDKLSITEIQERILGTVEAQITTLEQQAKDLEVKLQQSFYRLEETLNSLGKTSQPRLNRKQRRQKASKRFNAKIESEKKLEARKKNGIKRLRNSK